MACDQTLKVRHPKELPRADLVDYPSDEDSDDEIEFTLEVPNLEDLISGFEEGDAMI